MLRPVTHWARSAMEGQRMIYDEFVYVKCLCRVFNTVDSLDEHLQLFWLETNDQCQDFARAFQTQLEDLAPGDHSSSFARFLFLLHT